MSGVVHLHPNSVHMLETYDFCMRIFHEKILKKSLKRRHARDFGCFWAFFQGVVAAFTFC